MGTNISYEAEARQDSNPEDEDFLDREDIILDMDVMEDPPVTPSSNHVICSDPTLVAVELVEQQDSGGRG